ncbi:MAG: hypothetical protein A2V62_04065 [Nitrospirae bacterium RBG_19FT_COMBO_58_9]|nr:MAG: hypothetical protein A2V62_04065 [Nitrospirae bacterium RBG_19FT_COMBO_58_9]
MAARSEAEAHSLLVYKSPAWKGGVLYWLDHNAFLIGKPMLRRSTSTISHTTLTSSTELSTETGEQNLFIVSRENGALPGKASKGSPAIA